MDTYLYLTYLTYGRYMTKEEFKAKFKEVFGDIIDLRVYIGKDYIAFQGELTNKEEKK